MATIQIRDLSDETYEVIKRRAEKAGMSLQKYLWAELTESAARRTKAEILADIEDNLARSVRPGPTREQSLEALHSGRAERE